LGRGRGGQSSLCGLSKSVQPGVGGGPVTRENGIKAKKLNGSELNVHVVNLSS